MELELSDDQELLRETTERFVEAESPLLKVRELAERGEPYEPSYLEQAAQLGWFAMLVDEAHGGGSISGSGIADLAIICEERGRLLEPSPVVPMNGVAAALSGWGSDAQRDEPLAAVMAGAAVATWAVADASGSYDPGGVTRDGETLNGVAGLVQDADRAAWLLVTSAGPEGTAHDLLAADAPGITIEPLESLDITRRFSRVRFADVAVDESTSVGSAADAAQIFHQLISICATLTAAESVGAAGQFFDVATSYAKDRRAFGRPIGSFQAVKHLLADTGLLLEMGRSATVGATRALASGGVQADEAASMAKSFVSEEMIEVSHNSFQVFGGIAYTWEHDNHLYYRRAASDAVLFGDPSWHRERICSLHALGGDRVG